MGSTRRHVRTLVVDVILMVAAGFIPAVVMGILGWSAGVNVALLSGLAAFIACMGGTGWRTGLAIALPFSVFAGLATWVAPNPWLAALVLAAAAFLRGYAAKVGMHDALIMTVIALGYIVASPVPDGTPIASPLYVSLVSLLASLWATLVMFLLRRRLHVREHTALDPTRVLPFSLMLAVLVGVATWCVVALNLGHTGGWIILTILVVFQPSSSEGFRKAAERAAGTVLGFAIAIVVGAVVPSGGFLYLVGFLFLMCAFLLMLQGSPYWLYATVLTPAIVLLESAGSSVDAVAEQRLGATLIGVFATVLVLLVIAPFATRLTQGPKVGP